MSRVQLKYDFTWSGCAKFALSNQQIFIKRDLLISISDQLEIIQVDFYTVSIAREKLFPELLIWLSTYILDC